ncbi:MAG: hemerythrin domain-containing protein [Candidatus Aenigmatarchaeota archaeon]
MKLTEVQEEEHRAIEEALDILEKIGNKFEKDEEVDPEDIGDILDFLRTFADECHHGKEQDLLYTALEMKGISRKNSPIGLLTREHEICRNFIWNMERALEDYRGGDRTAKKDILQNAEAYIELLSQHIDKEDQLLYPMAEERIPEEDKEELRDAFDRFEKEVIGEGVHEEYHEKIKGLKEKFNEA